MIIIADAKKLNVELDSNELDLIIESLKQNPYSIVEFYGEGFTNLVKKLEGLR